MKATGPALSDPFRLAHTECSDAECVSAASAPRHIDVAFLATEGRDVSNWDVALEERIEAERYFRKQDRRDRVAARALLRAVLQLRYGVAAADWRFGRAANGRPYVLDPINRRFVQFNVSHTDGFVACVVSDGPLVGIDVEAISSDSDAATSLLEIMAPPERQWINAGPDSRAKEHRFYACWTAKEAFAKALGYGLGLAFDRFSILPTATGYILRCAASLEPDPSRWRFLRRAPAQHVHLSVAIRDTSAPVRFLDSSLLLSPSLHHVV